VQQVARENETGFLPLLKTEFRDIAKFDVIFVGFPTWGMQLPPPIKSFLKQYDLSGKRVVPFNSNGGYGLGTSFQTVRELCPNSQVLEGYSVKGGSERDGVLLALQGERAEQVREEIKRWLQRLALSKYRAHKSADQSLWRSLALRFIARHAVRHSGGSFGHALITSRSSASSRARSVELSRTSCALGRASGVLAASEFIV